MASHPHQILEKLLNLSLEKLKTIQDVELKAMYDQKLLALEDDAQARTRTALKHAYEQLETKSQRDDYLKNLEPQRFILSADSKGTLYEIEDVSKFKADSSALKDPVLKSKFDALDDFVKKNQLDNNEKVKLTSGYYDGKPCILISIKADNKQELEQILNKFRAEGYTIVPAAKNNAVNKEKNVTPEVVGSASAPKPR